MGRGATESEPWKRPPGPSSPTPDTVQEIREERRKSPALGGLSHKGKEEGSRGGHTAMSPE